MPYSKKSAAAKRRMEKQLADNPEGICPKKKYKCTGVRPPSVLWPMSRHSKKRQKVFFPDDSNNKKFVLVVGDCHLQAFVEQRIAMPESNVSFGFVSTFGATAVHLRQEANHIAVDRHVSKCVVLAPGKYNRLLKAGEDFETLLSAVLKRWHNVCVVDFPPRHTVPEATQNRFRQEYRKVATDKGLQYILAADKFPMNNLNLWVDDGVHLSEPEGMDVLVELIQVAVEDLRENGEKTEEEGCCKEKEEE